MIALLFWLLTLLACAFVIVRGGRDGRWAASLILAASVLTIPATRYGRMFGQPELAVWLVDLALLLGLYVLMVKSHRWWPIYMTGFHFIAVVSHMGAMFAPGFAPDIYFAVASFWAIPVPIVLVVGVWLDDQARRRGGQFTMLGSTSPG